MSLWILEAKTKANTWHIYRPTGVEVEVVVKNNMLRPTHEINAAEAQWFRDNVLQKWEQILNLNK